MFISCPKVTMPKTTSFKCVSVCILLMFLVIILVCCKSYQLLFFNYHISETEKPITTAHFSSLQLSFLGNLNYQENFKLPFFCNFQVLPIQEMLVPWVWWQFHNQILLSVSSWSWHPQFSIFFNCFESKCPKKLNLSAENPK